MLLGLDDVNHSKPDNCRLIPLYRAARNGELGVVKVLLEHPGGINPSQPGWLVWLEFSSYLLFLLLTW